MLPAVPVPQSASRAGLLDQPLYAVAEAARLLRVPERTLARWLGGYRRNERRYPPVISGVHEPAHEVTWGEFVEAEFVRRYRASDVSMAQLRRLIQRLREQFDVEYPLAHFRPYLGENRQLLLEVAEEAGVFMVVTGRRGQLVLTPPAATFLGTVEFDLDGQVDGSADRGIACALRPDGPGSVVTIRPDVAFGLPAVRGVRTEVLADALRAGEPLEDLAAGYDLEPDEVDAARRWELSARARSR